jgi:hypothetical protein
MNIDDSLKLKIDSISAVLLAIMATAFEYGSFWWTLHILLASFHAIAVLSYEPRKRLILNGWRP